MSKLRSEPHLHPAFLPRLHKETLPSTSGSGSAFNTPLQHLHFSQPCSLFSDGLSEILLETKALMQYFSYIFSSHDKYQAQSFAQQVLWAFTFNKFSTIYTCSLHPLCSEGPWSAPFNCISETSWKAMNYITPMFLKTLFSTNSHMFHVRSPQKYLLRLKLRP